MQTLTKVQKPTMLVIGIECRTSNDASAAPIDIPKLWQKFTDDNIFSQIPNKASGEVIGLYCDYEGDHTEPYSLVIGCAVTSLDEVPAGMVAKTVPASTFAVFEAAGEFPQSVLDTWGEIWSTGLKRTYVGDYEVYGEKFQTDERKPVDILIAIEN